MYLRDDIEVTGERFVEQHIVDIEVRSVALGRTVVVRLLTPREWSVDPGRKWPVLYLLHGGDDDPTGFTTHTDVVERAVADDLLVVLPPGGRAGFYTAWRRPDSHGTTPDWERFHLTELRELLERRYGASDVRAVAGVSMGGYGAVTYAAKHPGLFTAAASYSGMLHVTRPFAALLLRYYLRSVGERLNAMWGPRWTQRARWKRNDPVHLAERLAGTPLYLAAGDGARVAGDARAPGEKLIERLVAPATRELADRMAALGEPPRTSFGPGVHYWPSWQRELERSWPFLVGALKDTLAF
ncbi:alpha/beta hydrolase [Amycolatopsis anabasis]|uniref:alpha/beta hydrolase n=1 Tax=Amycolatopsis anabasis TaxID=1840409 RepID=UPI00131DC35D|nr:alpha/beta hydrolase family protein [Amycolatopsis anabasis]